MPAIFSPRADRNFRAAIVCIGLLLALGVWSLYSYATSAYLRIGYGPDQPVPFSHKIHVGQLGMDCRYCHTNVETSPHASVPPTQTCMNCHTQIKKDSPYLAPVRESWKTGEPVVWQRIHKLPDYAFFNHAVHIQRGVSCVSCHGQVNEMPIVQQKESLTMGWCLQCHRRPEKHLRPHDQVTNLIWAPPEGTSRQEVGRELKDRNKIAPTVTCQACHR